MAWCRHAMWTQVHVAIWRHDVLTHWGWDKMAVIFQTIFSHAFPEWKCTKFVPKGPINNIPVLVQIMAWRRISDKPLSEPMMVSLLTHICAIRPQWVNNIERSFSFMRLILPNHAHSVTECHLVESFLHASPTEFFFPIVSVNFIRCCRCIAIEKLFMGTKETRQHIELYEMV